MKGRNINFGKRSLLIFLIVVGLCSFMGGIVVAKNKDIEDFISTVPQQISSIFKSNVQQQTDMQWAIEAKHIASNANEAANPTQAQFLAMVMKEFGDTQAHPEYSLDKVKGHWAEAMYQAGKVNGVIPCSCVIKPDQPLTLKEAAEFVVRALYKKNKESIAGYQDVEDWAHRPDHDNKRNITYKEAAALIRKMHELKDQPTKMNGIQVNERKTTH